MRAIWNSRQQADGDMSSQKGSTPASQTDLGPTTTLWKAEQDVYNMMPTIVAARRRAQAVGATPPSIAIRRGLESVSSVIPGYDSTPTRKFTSEIVRCRIAQSIVPVNVLRVTRPDQVPKTHVFLIHGFAAAGAYMFKVVDKLSCKDGVAVFVLDLPGWGRSGKPGCGDRRSATEVENIFVEPINQVRMHYGLPEILLIGHSLGGYVSAVYAMRYPQTLKGLVLVSPIGFSKAEKTRERDPMLRTVMQGNPPKPYERLFDGRNYHLVLHPTPVVPLENLTGLAKQMVRIFGTSMPVRLVGDRYADWQVRMSWPKHKNEEELRALMVYFMYLARQSGETPDQEVTGDRIALDLFTNDRGALVHQPLDERFVKSYLTHQEYSLMFIYGSDDWVAPVDGFNAWWSIYHSLKLRPDQKDKVVFETLMDSGHHSYLDDTDGFVRAVWNQIQHG